MQHLGEYNGPESFIKICVLPRPENGNLICLKAWTLLLFTLIAHAGVLFSLVLWGFKVQCSHSILLFCKGTGDCQGAGPGASTGKAELPRWCGWLDRSHGLLPCSVPTTPAPGHFPQPGHLSKDQTLALRSSPAEPTEAPLPMRLR